MNTPVRARAQGQSPAAIGALAVLVCLAATASCVRRIPPAAPDRPPAGCSYQYSASVTIHCEQEGGGEETFLLLHGFGTSLETWHDVRPALARRGRVLMLDLKGFGRSSKPADAVYTPADQADIVAAFISERRLSRIVLAGHSYGGGVALLSHDRLARQGRDAVKALILIDAALYRQELPFFIEGLRVPLLNRLFLALTTPEFRARFTLRRIYRNQEAVTDERVERHARFLDAPGAREASIQVAMQINNLDFEKVERAVRAVRVPTLIVWGERDPVIPIANAHRLHDAIEHSRLEVIPASGHVPHEEYPETTLGAIFGFLGMREAVR
ncbi:MAG TPA: alpha/beta hydrolase [Vicinamibacterales bacterium]